MKGKLIFVISIIALSLSIVVTVVSALVKTDNNAIVFVFNLSNAGFSAIFAYLLTKHFSMKEWSDTELHNIIDKSLENIISGVTEQKVIDEIKKSESKEEMHKGLTIQQHYTEDKVVKELAKIAKLGELPREQVGQYLGYAIKKAEALQSESVQKLKNVKKALSYEIEKEKK